MSAKPSLRRRLAVSTAVAVLIGLGVLLTDDPSRREPPGAPSPVPLAERVQRGAYLATVGNCAGCHTAPGGAPYAGGLPLATPFGSAVAGNLTPDREHGLGAWTADDFWRALHHGRGRDGRRLLPVFPYENFTHVRREDSDALFAYLQSLPPVAQPNAPQALRFPYNTALALAVWQTLHFRPGTPPPASDAPVARGAYLVNGLGHCAACHAPRNALGAQRAGLGGGDMPGQGWHAPSLHPVQGLGVTAADTVALLRDGQHRWGTAAGPMAEVVQRSTQHWRAEDLQAVASYLAQVPAEPLRDARAGEGSARLLALGAKLYEKHCADCHGAQGEGAVDGSGRLAYPPLAGNPSLLQPTARNLARLIQEGGFAPSTAAHPRPYGMPPHRFTDTELAALLTHLRRSWGHQASTVDEVEVLRWR